MPGRKVCVTLSKIFAAVTNARLLGVTSPQQTFCQHYSIQAITVFYTVTVPPILDTLAALTPTPLVPPTIGR